MDVRILLQNQCTLAHQLQISHILEIVMVLLLFIIYLIMETILNGNLEMDFIVQIQLLI